MMKTSPGLAENLAKTGSRSNLAASAPARPDENMDLQKQLDDEKEKNRKFEDQYKLRVTSFHKRETQMKNKLDALERRLNDGPEADAHSTRMTAIADMHTRVMSGLDCIQSNTAKILQDQEKDLMRAFRSRLQEVSQDHEAQKSKRGEHSTELQAQHRSVLAKLHESQKLAQFYDKKNKQLHEDNQKLQEKLRTRDTDSKAVMKELFLAKKELARLKAQCKEGQAPAPEVERGQQEEATPVQKRREFTQRQIEQAQLQQTRNKTYEREVGYRDAITKLKRMVEAERKTLRGVKQQLADVLQQRTELEVLLKQCLDDVKTEILRGRTQGGPGGMNGLSPDGEGVHTMSVHELGAQERERVLELLLSQQRVVQLLYSKTFSNNPPVPTALEEDVPRSAGSGQHRFTEERQDDFSWLSDIIPPSAEHQDG